MIKYSFGKGFQKGAISFCLFAIPFALNVLPAEWMNLTVGGILIIVMNWLKVKFINL